jgi:limonene-1,2-epoxide hydrolase
MPTRETVEAFIAAVETNDHVAAIERFYAEDASMQENLAPPRHGRDHLAAQEKKVLAGVKAVRSRCVRPVLIDGDTVVINWIFEFDYPDGRSKVIDEIAHQTWRGDKIWRERFYYDPAQMRG